MTSDGLRYIENLESKELKKIVLPVDQKEMDQKMFEGLQSKSDKSNYLLTIVVAVFIIILSVIQLVNIL